MTLITPGSQAEARPSRTVAEWLWPFLPMGVAAFSLSALLWYHLRQDVFAVRSPLQQFYAGWYRAVGLAPSVLFCILVLTWSTIWLVAGRLERPLARLLRLVAMAVLLGVFLNLGEGGVSAPHHGALGAWLAETLVVAIGYVPSLVLVFLATFASLLLATDFFFSERFERAVGPANADAGVEQAVTDHLRQLAGAAEPLAAPVAAAAVWQPSAAGDDAAATAEAGRSDADGAFDDEPAELAVEPVVEPPRRRLSYYERRAAARQEHDEEWAPPEAPDNQEIADPEVDAAAVAESGPESETETEVLAESTAPAEPEPEPVAQGEPVAAAPVPASGTPLEPVDLAPEVQSEPIVELASAAPVEPTVAIPRPEPLPSPPAEGDAVARQQPLFGGVDEALIQEAVEVVLGARRASVALLQRKLRIDYLLASDVLAELAARGVVALDGDATQGRVLG